MIQLCYLVNTLNHHSDQSYCTNLQQQITAHQQQQMKADQSYAAFIAAKPYMLGYQDTQINYTQANEFQIF